MGFQERRQQLAETFKPREEWWSRVFATPLAYGVLLLIADWRALTPNRLTLLSLGTTLLTCYLIIRGEPSDHILAAIALQVAYVMDCMDGQLARYRRASSRLGAFADKWSDFVKFPAILLALTVNAFQVDPSLSTAVLGFAAVFLVGYLPYLKSLASSELNIGPWTILSGPGFVSRNLRFFLFEEAQWYMAISLCLVFNSSRAGLLVIVVSQAAIAFAQTARVLVLLNRPSQQ